MINEKENIKCLTLRERIKFFSFGIVLGCIGGLFWQEYFSPIEIYPSMSVQEENYVMKSETDEKLLKYIKGKWRSSIGDLIVNIQESKVNGTFIVLENILIKPKREEKFRVVEIEKIDGLFGIVKLRVCKENTECSYNESIPVQINKIFGTDGVISMTYTSDFAYCVDGKKLCTRSFREVE